MRALVLFVQLLLWLLIIRVVLRGLAGIFAPRAIEDLVPCDVCRAHVPGSRAVAARVGGRDARFCSARCRDEALAAVARAS